MIICFEESDVITMTADEINKLEIDFATLTDQTYVVYETIDGEQWPVGFEPGVYELTRPEHVQKSNPCFNDLSICKTK